MATRRHAYYSGNVQGVGFRFTSRRAAGAHDVTGFVRNLSDGRVELVVEGAESEVAAMVSDLEEAMGGHIRERQISEEPPTGRFDSFAVKPTR